MALEEGDAILCTVTKIERTTVFVKIEDNGEGTIVTSEIAPGRIRNIRDYVVPGKKIVCKILDIDKTGNMRLSLRRVTGKEKKEIMEKHEKEKSSLSILKSVLKDKASEIAEKIRKKGSLYDFLQSCKQEPKKLEKFVEKEQVEKICKILQEKKEKEKELKKEFYLATNASDGIIRIKKILSAYKNVSYLAAGKFFLKAKAADYKKANQELQKTLEEIEEKAKKENCDFSVKK